MPSLFPARLTGLTCLLAVGFFGITGCGKPVGQLAGTVTNKGAPVSRAELMFQSTANAEGQYFGISSDSGAYSINYRGQNGMPLGGYTVTVSHYTLSNGKPLPPGEEGEALKNKKGAVKKATYDFAVDVLAGVNKIDFELTQAKNKKAGAKKK